MRIQSPSVKSVPSVLSAVVHKDVGQIKSRRKSELSEAVLKFNKNLTYDLGVHMVRKLSN